MAQDLLRYCGSCWKMVHYMRCTPGAKATPFFQKFDTRVREVASTVLGLPPDDEEWQQAILAIRLGGLGLRRSYEHRSAAALASLSGTAALAKKLDPTYEINAREWAILAKDFNERVGSEQVPLEPPKGALSQRQLSQQLEEVQLERLLESLPDTGKARLLQFKLPYASSWITGPPQPDATLSTPQFQVLARYRLGMPVYDLAQTPNCTRCGEPLDTDGLHGLTCKHGNRQSDVHDALMAKLADHTVEAGLRGKLEKRGLVPFSNKRPADVWLPSGLTGDRPIAIDGVVPNPLTRTYVRGAAKFAGFAAATAEARKRNHRQPQVAHTGAHLVPFAVEYLGGFGASAAYFLRSVARTKAVRNLTDKAGEVRRMAGALSTTMVRQAALHALTIGTLLVAPHLPRTQRQRTTPPLTQDGYEPDLGGPDTLYPEWFGDDGAPDELPFGDDAPPSPTMRFQTSGNAAPPAGEGEDGDAQMDEASLPPPLSQSQATMIPAGF